MTKPEPEKSLWSSWYTRIAIFTCVCLVVHFAMWTVTGSIWKIKYSDLPLLAALFVGGGPMIYELIAGMLHGKFGADLLAAVSIVTSLLLGEYLAGSIVVLMLSGGQALEAYAVRNASAVLAALASRMPTSVHRKTDTGEETITLEQVVPGDLLVVYPHEICPVDGTVQSGHGSMDESYLSGEPYLVPKSLGSSVLSGAINGGSVLVITATHLASDSRYAKIMQVMQDSAQQRPSLRRLGDQLGAWYTPLAVAIAILAWWLSGEPMRFLAVLVVATPCPLLIAIPVAVIGSISLAARNSIIIKDPAVLERLDLVRTAMFDKTGTLTYGRPVVTNIVPAAGMDQRRLLQYTASLEHYSKHPLSGAVINAAEEQHVELLHCLEVHEEPGQGLRGRIDTADVLVTSRKKMAAQYPDAVSQLPPQLPGMECIVAVDGKYAGAIQFRDQPRSEGHSFVQHLGPKHGIARVLLVSGDRLEEVSYLAEKMGISEVYSSQSPEQKLEIVRKETALGDTLYMGDGINDAPALTAATIGIAFGQGSEITGEAADVVILDSSLERVDQLLHIGRRMRRIALQSAVGGMLLSIGGMGLACFGFLPPVAGALLQEGIDVLAVLNALRAAAPPKSLTDFQ